MNFFMTAIIIFTFLLNFRVGDSYKCYAEMKMNVQGINLNMEGEADGCDTNLKSIFLGKVMRCINVNCGETGYIKGCSTCAEVQPFIYQLDVGGGIKCECHECESAYCNSALSIITNFKFFIQLTIILIGALHLPQVLI